MSRYIVTWRDITSENEKAFRSMEAASRFADTIRWEAVGGVVITTMDGKDDD